MPTLPIGEVQRKTLPFEVKATTEPDAQFAGTFEGYCAGIHNIDRAGDMILPGAFADTIADFLAEGVVCWQHDWATPIGVPLTASEDSHGLRTSCRISKTQRGEEAMTLIRDRVVKKLSIGYRVQDYQCVDRAGLSAYLAGAALTPKKQAEILRQYDEMELDELYLLKRIKLYEYSPVSVPANPGAIITDAKGLLTGLTFANHSKAVLTAVQGLTERAHGVVALKTNRKTRLNAERRSELEEMAGLLDQSLASLRSLLNEPDATNDSEARQLLAEFERIQARSLGCAV
jgi:HK97 family phage prohead protease